MNHYTLQESMKKFKYGDKSAFDNIYELTNKFVFYYAYSILNDYELAKDVMQNTYLNIMQKISQYQDNTNPNAWITTITKNLAFDEINKNKKYKLVDVDENEYLFGVEEDKHDIDSPLINLAKKILPDDEFQIIALCVLGDHTREEVGIMLNKPTSTITWKYLNAMKTLKKRLKEGGEL